MKNKVIFLVIILLSITLLILVINNNNSHKKTTIKQNNNSNVIKDSVLENLSITKASLVVDKKNTSTFSAVVTNAGEINNIEYINIIFKDKEGHVITTLLGYVGLDLKKGDMTKIYATTDINLSNVTTVEYEKGSAE